MSQLAVEQGRRPNSQATPGVRATGRQHWLISFARAPGRAVEFLRYTGASGISFALDTSIFMAVISFSTIPASLAGAIGYLCGLILNYAICAAFIFEPAATGKSNHRLIAEYLASGLLGLILTFSTIHLMTEALQIPPLAAKLITVGIVFLAIYVLRSAKIFASQSND